MSPVQAGHRVAVKKTDIGERWAEVRWMRTGSSPERSWWDLGPKLFIFWGHGMKMFEDN